MPKDIEKVRKACRATQREMHNRRVRITKVVLPTILSLVIATTGFGYAQVRARTFKDGDQIKRYSTFYEEEGVLTDESLDTFLKVQGLAFEEEKNIEVNNKYNDIDVQEINDLVKKLFEASFDLIKVKIAQATKCRDINRININMENGQIKSITIFTDGYREAAIEGSNIDLELKTYIEQYEIFKKTIGKDLTVLSEVEDFATVAGVCREMGSLMKDLMASALTYDKDANKLIVGSESSSQKEIPGAPQNENDEVKGEPKIGIDLSYCQPFVDYNALASKVDFVGMRFTDFYNLKDKYNYPSAEYWAAVDLDEVNWDKIYERSGEGIDKTLSTHIAGFGDKVKMIYSFTNASSVNEAKAEALFIVHALKKLNITTVPFIYYDIELARYFTNGNKDEAVQMCLAFCKTIEEAGYFAGIYISEANLETLASAKEGYKLRDYNIWLAKWKYYHDFDIKTVDRSIPSYEDGFCYGINQVSEKWQDPAIRGANQELHDVDVNIMDNYLFEYATQRQQEMSQKQVTR